MNGFSVNNHLQTHYSSCAILADMEQHSPWTPERCTVCNKKVNKIHAHLRKHAVLNVISEKIYRPAIYTALLSEYNAKKREYEDKSQASAENICFICKKTNGRDSEISSGEWKTIDEINVHYYCLVTGFFLDILVWVGTSNFEH